jgi:hypothetical protein
MQNFTARVREKSGVDLFERDLGGVGAQYRSNLEDSCNNFEL